MKGLFSIRAKFLIVMSSLLLACVILYLLIAVKVFKTDKTELVYDLNRSMVSNLSAELDTEFSGISNQLKIFALLSTQSSTKSLVENIFSENSEIVFSSIYKNQTLYTTQKFIDKKYLETYGLQPDFFEKTLGVQKPIPFQDILRDGEMLWNASIEGGTALIGYGRNVVIENSKGIPIDHLAVIAYIKPDKILKSLKLVSLSEIAVVDRNGNLLIHLNSEDLKSQKSYSKHPLFESARDSQVAISVVSLKDQEGDFLGAFARSYQDKIFVLARASEDKAFAAVKSLVFRSLLFASIVITISLLFALLLSKSLTQPISILVEGMEKVSAGDLTTEIQVNSRDETQMLATRFNQMIRDLQQSRDALQEINRDLDLKVKERTQQLEIQNRAVQEAQEALLRTTRLASAGEIAGRAAHEVLNPLTGILTRVNSLEKKLKSEAQAQLDLMKDIFESWRSDQKSGGFEKLVTNWIAPSAVDQKMNLWTEDLENLDSVQNQFRKLFANLENDMQFLAHEASRISKIINGMRKLSHLKSDVKTYSARKLLTDCRNIMADLFDQNQIQIEEDLFSGTDEIQIDRDEFIQAVTNLMRNSLQAMTGSEVRKNLKIQLKSFCQDSNLIIEITDNGSGVLPEHQSLLFEKQFTTKAPDDGTGLGLGISRRFLRAHGGDIVFVASSPWLETKFQIRIPRLGILTQAGAA